MKRLAILLVTLGSLVGLSFALSDSQAIQVEADMMIYAGDAWEVTVSIPDAAAGDTVKAHLFNGLHIFSTTLTLGTGGIAVWSIPTGEISQAGDSLLVIDYGDYTVRRRLQVVAKSPHTVDFFATANTILAYGDGATTLIALPRDLWGNPPADAAAFLLRVVYPDGTPLEAAVDYTNGIGRYPIYSHGIPGRVRLELDHPTASASLEIVQTPGIPAYLGLTLSARCILADGRDVLSLVAAVQDSHNNPVADGTLVLFTWHDGFGYGRTIDGQATLRLPAPRTTGVVLYRAAAGGVTSRAAVLRIREARCNE